MVEPNDPQNESFEEREERHRALKQIALFPGSVEEYEKFRGYKVEIIDTKQPDKGIQLDSLFDDRLQDADYRINNRRLGKLLVSEGVEALVNVVPGNFLSNSSYNSLRYGLPVKRKVTN